MWLLIQGVFFYRDRIFEMGQKPEFGSLEHSEMIGGSVTSQSCSKSMDRHNFDVPEVLFFASPKVVKKHIKGFTGRVTTRMTISQSI